jgi:hypothetical protein
MAFNVIRYMSTRSFQHDFFGLCDYVDFITILVITGETKTIFSYSKYFFL